MGNEEQNIDEKGEEGDEEGGKGKDKQGQEIAGRVGGRVEVSGDGETKANERHQGSDWVDDENGRQSMALCGGQGEVVVGGIAEEGLRVVADHGPFAVDIVAVAQDTKVDAAIGSEWDVLDDGRGQRGQQQQAKGDEE